MGGGFHPYRSARSSRSTRSLGHVWLGVIRTLHTRLTPHILLSCAWVCFLRGCIITPFHAALFNVDVDKYALAALCNALWCSSPPRTECHVRSRLIRANVHQLRMLSTILKREFFMHKCAPSWHVHGSIWLGRSKPSGLCEQACGCFEVWRGHWFRFQLRIRR